MVARVRARLLLALSARPEDRPSAATACHDDRSKVPGRKVSLQAIVALGCPGTKARASIEA
eukprot:6173681-Prymnesium_polylepis.1